MTNEAFGTFDPQNINVEHDAGRTLQMKQQFNGLAPNQPL